MSTRLSRTVLTLVLVAVILTLTPLAHADHLIPPGSPESGTMMTLMMVGYVTSAAGLLPNPVVCDLRPVALPALLSPLGFQAVVSAPCSASSPRAPPTF